MGLLPFTKIECPATVRQPAHDHAVASDHLHPVDAQIDARLSCRAPCGCTLCVPFCSRQNGLPRLVRPAGDHQAPGDQRTGIPRPAGLHRQIRQIDRITLQHMPLTGRTLDHLGRHIQHLAKHRELLPGILHALGRLRLLELRQQDAHLTQRRHRLLAHTQGDALGRAEQVTQHRRTVAFRVLEQKSRPARAQRAIADLGHLQMRVHLGGDAL